MPHQTIHPTPRSTKVPPRFAGWAGPWAQARIERLQALHPELDIIGSFARVGELVLTNRWDGLDARRIGEVKA